MLIDQRCQIIEEFMREYSLTDDFDDDAFHEFVSYNDMGIPLAQSVVYNLATLTDEGERLVTETWNSLCEIFDVEPDAEYKSIDDFFFEEDDDDDDDDV